MSYNGRAARVSDNEVDCEIKLDITVGSLRDASHNAGLSDASTLQPTSSLGIDKVLEDDQQTILASIASVIDTHVDDSHHTAPCNRPQSPKSAIFPRSSNGKYDNQIAMICPYLQCP